MLEWKLNLKTINCIIEQPFFLGKVLYKIITLRASGACTQLGMRNFDRHLSPLLQKTMLPIDLVHIK